MLLAHPFLTAIPWTSIVHTAIFAPDSQHSYGQELGLVCRCSGAGLALADSARLLTD